MVRKKLIISGVFVFLIVQYIALAIIEAGGHPFWPAFSLPGFKKVYGGDSRIEYSHYSLVSAYENKELEYEMSTLWSGIPGVQKRAIFRSAVKKSKDEIIKVSDEEYEWYASVFGDSHASDSLFIRVKRIERSIEKKDFPIQKTTITDYKIESNEID